MSNETAAIDRFIEAWGSMGALFGMGRSAARVSALLLVSGEEWTLGEIAERLEISRGNASMSLKELRGCGVVRRLDRLGDRRDRYVHEPDLWSALISIARERRRRELEPAVESALTALSALSAGRGSSALQRVGELRDFLEILRRLASQLLDHPEVARSLVTLARASLPRAG